MSKRYLYDARTNVTTETTLRKIEGITGMSINTLASYSSRKNKIIKINSYMSIEYPSLKQRRKWYSGEVYNDEYFKEIEGSEGKYRISNYGRVKIIYKTTEKLALPFRREKPGNLYVKVRFLGVYQDVKVGHLVAHHFIRPREKNERLLRKNGILTDDYAGNLKYVSLKELGERTGKLSKSKAVVKLCINTLEWLDEYKSAREAGRQNFMSYQTVLDSCHGKTKVVDGKYKFMFLSDYEKE